MENLIEKANLAYTERKAQIKLKQKTAAIKRISSTLKISEEEIIEGQNFFARNDRSAHYDFYPESGFKLVFFPGYYKSDGTLNCLSQESLRLASVDGQDVEIPTDEIKTLTNLGREIARVRDYRKRKTVVNEKLDEFLEESKVEIPKYKAMPRLTRYILEKICAKLVKQGFYHKSLITEYYEIIAKAAQREFTEDNSPTLKGFLEDCHKEAMRDF